MKLGKKLLMGFVTGVLILALGEYSMADYHITDVDELQAMDVHLADDCILDNDIDASATVGWNLGAGFVPVGTNANRFTGSFDGQGYTITGLFINRPATDYVGLFGYVDGVTLQNVTLANVNITGKGAVGALSGFIVGNSVVTNCHSSGTLLAEIGVGGLIGFTGSLGAPADIEQITSCDSSASVTTRIWGAKAGGLIGETLYTTISDCFATGPVTDLVPALGSFSTGGLIGIAQSITISNCYATGRVKGVFYVGGLIGDFRIDSTMSNCYATGDVSGGESVGGLAGSFRDATISDCYATGNVFGAVTYYHGGLVGEATLGVIQRSCASGDVSGIDAVGGLVGLFTGWGGVGSLSESYSLGIVQATGNNVGGLVGSFGDDSLIISDCFSRSPTIGVNRVGGLIGVTSGPTRRCFSTGPVTGTGVDIGGLIGIHWFAGATFDSFWDTETSGQAISAGGTGKTTTQMHTRSTFTDAEWNFVTIWGICEWSLYLPGYPFLLNNGKCESTDCTARKVPLPPDNLLCEQKKNPRDVTDPQPEFSAIYRDP